MASRRHRWFGGLVQAIGRVLGLRARIEAQPLRLWMAMLLAVNACGAAVAPSNSEIRFVTDNGACASSCWSTPITMFIDGTSVGSMSCPGTSSSTSEPVGSYTVRACSKTCISQTVMLPVNTLLTIDLTCSNGIPGVRTRAAGMF
jgi:hypothetical protein